MKKAIAIFFLMIYAFTSVGATVHMHYCMGNFVESSLTENKNATCKKCGMKEVANKKGCCKDEVKEYKLKLDQNTNNIADVVKIFSAPLFIKPIDSNNNFEFYSNISNINYCKYHPPPNIYIQNLQVLYSNFLI